MNVKPLTETQKMLYEIAIDPKQAHKFWRHIITLQTFVQHYNRIWLVVCAAMFTVGFMLGVRK